MQGMNADALRSDDDGPARGPEAQSHQAIGAPRQSGNGERHGMSAEEARREHSDPRADRTVAGVPGARSGHDDGDDEQSTGPHPLFAR